MPVTQIVLAGDSIAAGEVTQESATAAGGKGSWSEQLAEGIANLGIYGPLVGAGIRVTNYDLQWTSSGSWSTTVFTDLFDKSFFGLAPYAANGATKTYTHPTQWRHCAGFAIYWIDYAAGGNWQYRIDGGTWTNVDATETRLGDNNLKKFYVNTAVTSTVDFRAFNGTSNTGICLCGLEPFFVDPRTLDTGFVMHNVSHSGDFLASFVNPTNPDGAGDRLAFWDSVVPGSGNPISNQPDLVFAGTFTNDVLFLNPTVYEANIHTVYQRTINGGGRFAYINAYEEGGRVFADQQTLRNAAKTQAAADGFPIIDLFDAWSANGWGAVGTQITAATAQGLMHTSDVLHPSQQGNTDIGTRLVAWAYTSVLTDRTRHRLKPFVMGRSQLSGTDNLGGTLEVDPAVRFHRSRPKPPGRRAPSGVGFRPRVSHTGDRQACTPAGIASTVAFGAPRDVITFHPTGIASVAAVALPFVTTIPGTYFLTLTGIPSSVAFGDAAIVQVTHLLATGIAPTESIPTVAAVTVRDIKTLVPTGIASTNAFGSPVLSAGSQAQVLPTGIASVATVASPLATTIPTPAILSRTLRLRPPGRKAPNGIGFRRYLQPSAHDSKTISVSGIPPNGTYTTQSGAAYTNQAGVAYTIQAFPTIGHPTVTRVRTIVCTGIPSTNQFGSPNVRGPGRIQATGIPTTVAFGSPSFTRFQTAILPVGIPSTVRFGTIGSRTTTGITGIASTVVFGEPTVGPTAQWNVKEAFPRWRAGFPHGRWHAYDAVEEDPNAQYHHVARPVGPADHRLVPAGISSTVAFGDVTFPATQQTAAPIGIAPTSVFGEPALNRGTLVTITLPGISSTVALGSPRLGPHAFTGPAGIPSTLAFGAPSVARPARRTITITGIASTLHLGPGTLAKRPNKKFLSPTGIAGTVAFGAPTVFRKATGPPPPPPDVIVPFSVADPNGVIDIADALSAWASTHVVSGTQANPQRVLFQRLKNNGQRATYRIDRAVHLANGKHDIVFDGGGGDIVIADDGTLLSGGDGANFIQTVDAPFTATADPNTNPRGAFRHNGATLPAPVDPYANFVTYAIGDIIHSGGNQYQSKLPGNLNHLPPNATWWTSLGPDGQLTSRDGPTGPAIDFIALGVIPGDQVRILNPANLHLERDIVVNVVHNSTTITIPTGSPDAFATADRGALMTSTKLGFPSGEIIGYFIDATHMTLSEYYTGVTGTATVHIGNTNHTDRNVIAITGQHTLTYGGGSLGQGTSDITVNPNDGWANIYTPTNVVESTWNSYDQASNRAFDQNRGRSFLNFTKATRVKVHGFCLTGRFTTYDGSVTTFFDYEAQDGIQWDACNNVEESNCVITQMWGNGFEQRQFVENDGSLTPTRGLWVHDCWHSKFNRQAASLTFGYNAIIERSYLGESQRSLIDCEPTTTRVGTGTNPTLTYAMQDIQLIDCIIGDHALGMLSCHEGVGRIHLLRVRAKTTYAAAGGAIGSSGVAFCDWLLVEDCVSDEPGSASSSYAWQFTTGVRQGGHNIMILNSQKMHSRIAVVHFGQDHGPCTNYLINGNDGGTGIPQSLDDSGGDGTPITLFALPIPPHALRDAAP